MKPMPSPPDSNDEAFLRLFTHHEPELRAYVRASLPRPQDVDEVMQELSLVAWRKFPTLEDPGRFGAWACLIARYEILKHRRRIARDRLVLDEDVVERLAEEGADEGPRRQARLDALDHCVRQLPHDRRRLVLAAYRPDFTIRELAAREGRSEGALYQLLARLRQQLLSCIERRLATDP